MSEKVLIIWDDKIFSNSGFSLLQGPAWSSWVDAPLYVWATQQAFNVPEIQADHSFNTMTNTF